MFVSIVRRSIHGLAEYTRNELCGGKPWDEEIQEFYSLNIKALRESGYDINNVAVNVFDKFYSYNRYYLLLHLIQAKEKFEAGDFFINNHRDTCLLCDRALNNSKWFQATHKDARELVNLIEGPFERYF
jgi:hypothetical protein